MIVYVLGKRNDNRGTPRAIRITAWEQPIYLDSYNLPVLSQTSFVTHEKNRAWGTLKSTIRGWVLLLASQDTATRLTFDSEHTFEIIPSDPGGHTYSITTITIVPVSHLAVAASRAPFKSLTSFLCGSPWQMITQCGDRGATYPILPQLTTTIGCHQKNTIQLPPGLSEEVHLQVQTKIDKSLFIQCLEGELEVDSKTVTEITIDSDAAMRLVPSRAKIVFKQSKVSIGVNEGSRSPV